MKDMLQCERQIGWCKYGFVLSFYFLLMIDEEDPNAFHNAIRETIAQGGDTDTNACIVGGMIGAYLGIQKLPEDMVSKVLNFDCENPFDEEMRPAGIKRPAFFN